MNVIRVVVADDHPLMLGAVRARLSIEPDINVVAAVGSCAGLLSAVSALQPDVALADVRMADGSTLAILDRLAEVSPATRVVLLSGTANRADVADAMEKHAAGFLLKTVSPDELPRHLRAAVAGETVLDAAAAAAVVSALRHPHVRPVLTDREREVIGLVATGLTNERIARHLHVSISTVKSHLERIYQKLGVDDRAAAVAQAKDHGLL